MDQQHKEVAAELRKQEMNTIFEQLEPDILLQYYDKGEGLWQKVKRLAGNILRRLKGDELLDYNERLFEDEEGLGEWMRFSDEW